MNNVLVTGGCGFIGGHLVDEIKSTHPSVRVVVEIGRASCRERV